MVEVGKELEMVVAESRDLQMACLSRRVRVKAFPDAKT